MGRMSAEAPAWFHTDFLIHGEYCPIEEIEEVVDQARRRVEAAAALLLVADEWVMMRTLCHCVPAGRPEVDRMRVMLAKASLLPKPRYGEKRRRSRALQDLIRGPRSGRELRFPDTAADVMEELAIVAMENDDPQLASWLMRGIPPWVPARVPDRLRGARMRCALLFLEPRRARLAGGTLVAADDELVDISARVHATAHANVRRDHVIMERLDQKLDPAVIAGSEDFSATAQPLVELVLGIADANIASCYLVDYSEAKLHRKAHRGIRVGQAWAYPEELSTNASTLAAAATAKHRTLQLPPGLGGELVEPTPRPKRRRSEERVIELAAPLPGPLATPKAPAVGVLTVARIGDPRPFGAYEMAVVRNVALRLALVATTTNTTQAAKMFARLSHRSAGHPPGPISEGERESTPPRITLPDDIAWGLHPIEDALTTLGEVTRAGSATFRAALPAGDPASPHGLTLARVAGYPAEVGRDEEHAVQSKEEGGHNWCAVISGEIGNFPVVRRGEKTYSEHRKGTRSELSVPVNVEDRVVGVVNLESPVEHAFDAHVELAQAAAEHIGLVIANARLALSTAVQERATEVLRVAHEITHEPEEIRKEADDLPAEKADRVLALADGIHEKVKKLRYGQPDGEDLLPPGEPTFPEIVRFSVKRLGMEADFQSDEGPWTPHPAQQALAIAKALGDVLDNAVEHRGRRTHPPHLTITRDRWGGRRQDVLIVHTVPDRYCPEAEAINVYRCPLDPDPAVEGEEEAHLGAYLAGLQIRRIGGEVHLSYERNLARVVVSVPAPERGSEENANREEER
jgi:hypothetical protein